MSSGVGITGSGGFIGSHLTRLLRQTASAHTVDANICSANELARLGKDWKVHSLVHLAAAGTVLTELADVPRMFDVSVDGLLHSLQVFQPRRVVFSSSCAVYGNSPLEGASPTWQDVHPISVYGLSKAAAEKVLEQWARQTRSVAVLVRMGNVVGSGCAGLISYLVRHAVQHPDGTVPANMRGGGKIVRDYVPVSYVVQIVRMALEEDFEPGSAPVLNAGSGRTVSNGEVASILKEWLAKQGYRLNIVFQPNAAPSEASYTALRTELTECRFNLNSPSSEAVREAILDGARSCLTQLTSSTLSSQASV